ncbi:hypothetical protein OG689_39890 [Kitasatospora sp. NBC_00240]|nr:hypothetical protein [Kitasatospora sp. NBC_00240]MCX5215341.1 hypothetical protein [Kitasatospora sp. NBC_00240]
MLYPAPAAGVHRQRWSGSFGDLVPIPAPFAFDLATGDLVRYPV